MKARQPSNLITGLIVCLSTMAHVASADPRPRKPLSELVPDGRSEFARLLTNRDFRASAQSANNGLRRTIAQRIPVNEREQYQARIDAFVARAAASFSPPDAVDEEFLKGFACSRRPESSYFFGAENLRPTSDSRAEEAAVGIIPRATPLDCRVKATGEFWTQSFGRGESDLQMKTLIEYLYGLNAEPSLVNVQTWFLYRIIDFLQFHVDSGGLEWSRDGSPVFSFAVTVDYFRTRLPLEVREKSAEIVDGIIHDDADYTYALQFNSEGEFGLPGNTIPTVHNAVTCRGSCVVFDTSSFARFVGTFTYPWQILFHFDVRPEFLDAYKNLLKRA